MIFWSLFAAVLAASVLAQLFIDGHAHFAPERFFAWNALYGFLACAALIVLAKVLGFLVKRNEQYYDDA